MSKGDRIILQRWDDEFAPTDGPKKEKEKEVKREESNQSINKRSNTEVEGGRENVSPSLPKRGKIQNNIYSVMIKLFSKSFWEMLSSYRPEQWATESIYMLIHCRSVLPTHNVNIIAWEEEEGKVETAAEEIGFERTERSASL